MNLVKRNSDIIFILIIGFVLRFTISITHSYTNDELSAITRLNYSSFNELIEFGVKTGDMHPAGVQVFMKGWSSLFGTSELAMRFPFVLCGVLSIAVLFVIGLKWFNRRTGIIAAALLAILYFPIINAELARPYSPGLLIALLTAWFYHKVLFCEVKKYKNAILLGLCFAAGMYTHYFLFLFVGFIGITGLFFLNKDNYKLYLLAGIVGIVLFIPHLQITLFHLSVGGLQWLGPPDKTWLFEFLFFAFNSSFIFLLVLLLVLAVSFLKQDEKIKIRSNYFTLILVWFFGIYVIGHILSLVSTPILKAPVMLFAFPFLLLLIGLLVSRSKFYVPSLIVLLSVGLVSTVYENELFGIKHQGYKNTAKHIVEWKKQYGEENIYTVYNLSNPEYMNFYAKQFGDSLSFDWEVIEFADDIPIRRDLMNRTEPYCIVGYSERLTLPQVFETVREFYPTIVAQHQFENSAVFLMHKAPQDLVETLPVEISFSKLFDAKDAKDWVLDPAGVVGDPNVSTSAYLLDENRIYGPDYVFNTARIIGVDKMYLKIIVEAQCEEDAQLTVAFNGSRNGQPIQYSGEVMWIGHDLEEMILTTKDSISGIGSGYFAFEIPEYIKTTDELKISLWNRNGKRILITSFEILMVENRWN